MLFDVCNLDFDQMALVHKLDLDIMITHFHTINEAKKSNGSKQWLRNTENFLLFDVSDHDFALITSVLKLDLNIMMAYFYMRSIDNLVWKLLSGNTDRHVFNF